MTLEEAARVEAVEALAVMGSTPDPDFDRLARLVGHVAHAAYAHVCFIDGTHQFIKASEGEDLPRLLRREDTICAEAVLTRFPLSIRDFRSDPRGPCRGLYERHGFTSYAGVPIRLPSQHVVGAVAVMSRDALSLSDRQWAALEECAELAGREALAKRHGAPAGSANTFGDGSKAQDALRTIMMSHIRVLRAVSDGVIVLRGDGSINFANAAAERMLGRLPGSLIEGRFEAEVLHPEGCDAPPGGGSPVRAALEDGAERLVRSALFRRAKDDAVRVGYVVSPILAEARPIGAVVVFRALEREEFSNGVDLRNTLREVARLKRQFAKAVAQQHLAGLLAHRPLPSLSSGTPVDFDRLRDAIREERAGQLMRALAGGAAGSDGLRGSPAPAAPGSDPAPPGLALGMSRGLSRTERWLASEPARIASPGAVQLP